RKILEAVHEADFHEAIHHYMIDEMLLKLNKDGLRLMRRLIIVLSSSAVFHLKSEEAGDRDLVIKIQDLLLRKWVVRLNFMHREANKGTE
ncbi:hypothetical protein HN51_031342, partial [Arachis hypogaea]